MVTIVIVIFLLLGIYTGARRGLALQILHLVGYILSTFIAVFGYRAFSKMIEMYVPFPSYIPGTHLAVFSDGQAFEPDFLLFANDKKTGNISWQIFIEPKGSQFLDSNNTFKNSKEGWKEAFLNEITERSESKVLIDDDKYRIIGLPFFNEKNTKSQFESALKNVLPDPELE